ncbi:Ig-like domain-containing protein [Mycoplasma sp. 6243]|uniref:Ig-like domain-containing protein n=1 Tax=Mycoplasma sp. 6243 TaxID=3440865 RepID=UPI003EBF01BA
MRKKDKLLTSLLFISASTTAIAASCGSQGSTTKPKTPEEGKTPGEQPKPGNQTPPDEGSKPGDGTQKPGGGETTNPGEEIKPGQGSGSQTQNPGGSGESGNKPGDGSGNGSQTTPPENGGQNSGNSQGNVDSKPGNGSENQTTPPGNANELNPSDTDDLDEEQTSKQPASILDIDANNLHSEINNELVLPSKVNAIYSDGSKKEVDVTWDSAKVDKTRAAVYQITATVDGKSFVKEYEVYTFENAYQVESPYITVYENDSISLPATVNVFSKYDSKPEAVTWNSTTNVSTANGTSSDIQIKGHLNAYADKEVTAYLKVVDSNYTTGTQNIVDTTSSDPNHATATAVPAQTGIEKIVDGTWNNRDNNSNNWVGDRQANAQTGQITIDLKTAQDIGGVKLFMFADYNTGTNGPKSLYISTSEDGVNFHRVFNQSKYSDFTLVNSSTVGVTNENNSNNYKITFEKVHARYVRFDYVNYPRTDVPTKSYVFGLLEVFVYGATKTTGHRTKDASDSLESIVVKGNGVTSDTSTSFAADKLDYQGSSSFTDGFPTKVDFNLPNPSRARMQTFSIQIDKFTKKYYAFVWSETGVTKTYTYTHKLINKLKTVAFSVSDITIGQAQAVDASLVLEDGTKITPEWLDKDGFKFELVNSNLTNIFFDYQDGYFIGRHFTNSQPVVLKVKYQGVDYTSAPVNINVNETPGSNAFYMDNLSVAKTQTIDVLKGDNINLPKYIEAIYPGDKYPRWIDVTWDNVPEKADKVGFYTYKGTVSYRGFTRDVTAAVSVHDLVKVADTHIATLSGYAPILPTSVTVYDDLGNSYTKSVTFENLTEDELNSDQIVEKTATVTGTNLTVKLFVRKVPRTTTTKTTVVSQKTSGSSDLFPAAFASSTMTASASSDNSTAVTYSVDSLNDGTADASTTTSVWSNKHNVVAQNTKSEEGKNTQENAGASGEGGSASPAKSNDGQTTDEGSQEETHTVSTNSGAEGSHTDSSTSTGSSGKGSSVSEPMTQSMEVSTVAEVQEGKTVKQTPDTPAKVNENYVGIAFGSTTSASVKIDRVKVWFAAADTDKKIGIPTNLSVEYLSSAVTGLDSSNKSQLSNLNDDSSNATNLKTGTWTHITLQNQNPTIKPNDYTELIFAKPVDAYAVRIKFTLPNGSDAVVIKELQALSPDTNVTKESTFTLNVKYANNNYPGFNEHPEITDYTLAVDQSLNLLTFSATNNANIFTSYQDETLTVVVTSEDGSMSKTYKFKTNTADALIKERSDISKKVRRLLRKFADREYTLTKGTEIYAKAYKVYGMSKTAKLTELQKAWDDLQKLMNSNK